MHSTQPRRGHCNFLIPTNHNVYVVFIYIWMCAYMYIYAISYIYMRTNMQTITSTTVRNCFI